MTQRLSSTPLAEKLIHQLRNQHGELLFHLSGGCCDGSAPMCYSVNDFRIGESDIQLGKVAGAAFYVAHHHFDYISSTHLTLDVVEGRGSSFSLEIPLGVRFIIKSRLFTAEELVHLQTSLN